MVPYAIAGGRHMKIAIGSDHGGYELKKAIGKANKIISVECNATGQLSRLAASHGVNSAGKILKYDGRPFALDELENELKKVL